MDDYYELLDVAPDAEREDIRGAYRALRDELQSQDGDDARARIAELNRAWNVLSDPTQRRRYDERLADARAGDEDDGYDDEDGDEDERPVPVTRAQRRAQMQAKRQKKMPAVELPNGLTVASTKSRFSAMGTDLVILLALFFAVQLVGINRIDARFPGERKHATALQKQIDSASKKISADKKQVSAAKDKHDQVAEDAATKQQKADQNKHDALQKQYDDVNRKLAPWDKLVYAIGVVVAALYLIPLTALTGQTVGKRLQKVRVVKVADGSAPGWAASAKRWSVPLGLALVLGATFLGPYGLVFGVIVIVGWVNRPDRQGMHDRIAKTVVVDA
jgi:curved DNA-binding protein CbpA